MQNYISPGSPAPSVTWWKDGSVFDDTFELVEKQNNGASNSTVMVMVVVVEYTLTFLPTGDQYNAL